MEKGGRLEQSLMGRSGVGRLLLATAMFLLMTFSELDAQKHLPLFKQFVYEGNDRVYNDFPLESDEFYNPILQGVYPDAAITRKGNDYFLVSSSFAFFPGIPIFHSNEDRKSTRLNSSHVRISYAVFCLKKKKKTKYI